MKPADYLAYSATQFDASEVDGTFYRTPAISKVKGWYANTLSGFLFAAKCLSIPGGSVTRTVVFSSSCEFSVNAV